MSGHSKEEVRRLFYARIKGVLCPHCGEPYGDEAIVWAEAWQEGRMDLIREMGLDERDGPYKLRCASCGERAWLNIFSFTAEAADH